MDYCFEAMGHKQEVMQMNVLSLFLHNAQGFEMWDIMGQKLYKFKRQAICK